MFLEPQMRKIERDGGEGRRGRGKISALFFQKKT
jgi:hypothetical protein